MIFEACKNTEEWDKKIGILILNRIGVFMFDSVCVLVNHSRFFNGCSGSITHSIEEENIGK